MSSAHAQLLALLASELEQRLPAFAEASSATAIRAALHALRGSASVAGEHDLALVAAQIGARTRAGNLAAGRDALPVLRDAVARLRRGLSAFPGQWPEPPPLLEPTELDARYRADYLAAMRDHVTDLDGAISAHPDDDEAFRRALRSVHAMKGAAGGVGDDVTAWYCHGLEARLKSAERSGEAREALAELGRHRAMIAQLLEDPRHALESLRALAERSRPADEGSSRGWSNPPSSAHSASTSPQRRPTTIPPPGDEAAAEQGPRLRVPIEAVDRLLDRLERVDLSRAELAGTAELARQIAGRLREQRGALLEALRLIGPPRPWGAPAAALKSIETAARALGTAATNVERGSQMVRRSADGLRGAAAESRGELAGLRRTSAGWLFERVRAAVEALAEREGAAVQVLTRGGDLMIDRRMAEQLLDPVLQLARNAVAHGLEAPDARLRDGRAPVGSVWLAVERFGDWLTIVVEDDGRGVDPERIRRLAVESGAASADAVRGAGDDELLALLFLPGLTTKGSADLLAGRGVGLDLALSTVRRLGGTIRLSTRPGGGLIATVEVPSTGGLVDLLWVDAGGHTVAIPVGHTGRLKRARDEAGLVPLTACLGLTNGKAPQMALELVVRDARPVSVGVDAVGGVEQASVRVLPALVAASGPWRGAVLRGDGGLRLVLDAASVAARAVAQGAHGKV